jgi:hypothetical protein
MFVLVPFGSYIEKGGGSTQSTAFEGNATIVHILVLLIV